MIPANVSSSMDSPNRHEIQFSPFSTGFPNNVIPFPALLPDAGQNPWFCKAFFYRLRELSAKTQLKEEDLRECFFYNASGYLRAEV